MKSTKFKTKTEKGITLIALIITIVVLMILAAVAINSITNDGILLQAGSTANKYNQAVKDEESFLQDYEDMLTAANGGYKDKNFEVGDLVTVAGENFYVIEDKTNLGKVVLLAKECINTTTLKQENANFIAFSKTAYWCDENYNVLFTDLTEIGIPDESHYAARAAYDYGAKIGGKGRLMTYKEANDLKDTYGSIIFDKKGDSGYWLESADNTAAGNVYVSWCYESLGGIDYLGAYMVRPVIEISKSKVTKVQ